MKKHLVALGLALSTLAGCASPAMHPVASANAAHRGPMNPAEIAAQSLPSVVTIKSDQGFGTGFVVDHDGWIATNFHVVRGARSLVVGVADRGEFPVLEMLLLDEERDLAIVRIGEGNLPALALGDSHEVKVGDSIVAIGHPLGLEHTVSNGLVSAVRDLDQVTVFQVSAPIAPGSSGGPLLNDRGEVVGIVTATMVQGQNLNFGVPAAYLKAGMRETEALPFEQFAKRAAPAAAPARPYPHLDVAIVKGCSEGDLRLLGAILKVSMDDASGAFEAKHFETVDYLLEGASLAAERRLSGTCAGPKRTLAETRKAAAKKGDAIASMWAMRDGFASLLEVIGKKLP